MGSWSLLLLWVFEHIGQVLNLALKFGTPDDDFTFEGTRHL